MTADASSSQATRRRQLVLLAILAVVLGVAVAFVLLPALSGTVGGGGQVARAPSAPQTPASAAGGRGGAASRGQPDVVAVHLERLSTPAVDPVEGGRNPFRMGAAKPPPGEASAGAPRVPAAAGPPVAPGPPPPPPVPPIPFRFIGIVTGRAPTGRIAVLSDGKVVTHGREGEIIEGRYRIVKIGEESIQIEHADGRGRQTIRLSGQ